MTKRLASTFAVAIGSRRAVLGGAGEERPRDPRTTGPRSGRARLRNLRVVRLGAQALDRLGGPGVARLRDAGMTTAEYAIGTLAACGFAALLVTILSGSVVRGLLLAIIKRALAMGS